MTTRWLRAYRPNALLGVNNCAHVTFRPSNLRDLVSCEFFYTAPTLSQGNKHYFQSSTSLMEDPSRISLEVISRSRFSHPVRTEIEVDIRQPVHVLRTSLATNLGISARRLRITDSNGSALNFEKVPLDNGLRHKSKIIIKDLGPQIGWKTLYIFEYLGPLVIHPLVYFSTNTLYGSTFSHSYEQKVLLTLCMLHFLKRGLETIFLHRFSVESMPVFYIFKNCGHYWFLSGLNLAYWLYSPERAYDNNSTLVNFFWITLWCFSEISNFYTHLKLVKLRPVGTRVRSIPTGFGFDLVTCPNYSFEMLAWIAFVGISRSYAAALFTCVGAIQMFLWAQKKRQRYRKDFGSSWPRSRTLLVPWIL